MKKTISFVLALLFLVSCFTFAVNAVSLKYSLRIEGIEKCFFNSEIEIESEKEIDYTIADALKDLTKDAKYTVEGIENNYITSINGDKNGTFGGYDGWQYLVNGESPSVGVGDYKIKNGDSILFYYGDLACQIPVLDYSKVNEGILKVSSYDTVWSQDDKGEWVSNSAWNPVVDANLTVGENEFKTDNTGMVNLGNHFYSGTVKIQIEKKGENGIPLVCRFADNFIIPIEYTNQPATSSTEDASATEPASESQKTVVVLPENETMYVAQKFSINAKIINESGKTSYISNRKSVATVSKNGVVTAVKKGTATITVKNNGEKNTFIITVKNPKLNKKNVTLKKGGKFSIKITGKAGSQKYVSSDKKIAKVSKSGTITAKKKGKAVITVTTNKSVKLKIKVTVK